MSIAVVTGFVSYAHADHRLVEQFLRLMGPRFQNVPGLAIDGWSDHRILVGEDWDEALTEALTASDFGLLCLTHEFFASRYIRTRELPALLAAGRIVIPVLLEELDLATTDLRGLEQLQIFRYRPPEGGEPRSFQRCAGANRGAFCNELVAQIVARLGAP